jgi:hypothetical protein
MLPELILPIKEYLEYGLLLDIQNGDSFHYLIIIRLLQINWLLDMLLLETLDSG